jgi:hypothetical protein
VISALIDSYNVARLAATQRGDTLPTSLDVLATLRRRWAGIVASRLDVIDSCRTCGFALADMPHEAKPVRARPVVL